MSIGYMLYRSFGGAVDGSTLKLTPTLDVYFGIHGAIAILVMTLEVVVLGFGLSMLKRKGLTDCMENWSRFCSVLVVCFLSGEILYLVTYVL